MDPEAFERRRCSFGPSAELYDTYRPSYPAEAAAWMIGDPPQRVVDLGAGTGIFSRLAASLGHDVVAVEPDEGMRARLVAVSPGVAVLAGSAEAIPLPDASVEVVTAAQAFHWFDNDAARAEIARVLCAGGVFAPVWNVRDDAVPWVAELSRIAGLEDTHSSELAQDRDFGPAFAAPERRVFRHAVPQTAESLVSLVLSRSQWLVAGEDDRERVAGEVRALAAGLPEPFQLPYATVAYRAVRMA